ncbi:MAG: VIT1/CCC1 transporter family protein [Planctomycetes bacterium]|nr:VIT1/CCC1 transporter family protein [Planctomycetota bacterium]
MSLVRTLDPSTRLAELVFGLVMTLSFTLTASVLLREQGHGGARELLYAIFGCNLAWGVIDGGLYLLGQIVERGRKHRLWIALRSTRDEREAEALLSDELDELVGRGLEPAERSSLYRSLGQKLRALDPAPVRLTREDWRGALASCWLVFLTGIPAALPFFFIADPFVALRISNALLLLLLFYLGERTARALGFAHPLRAGASFLAFGILLVSVAIALGG